MVAAAVPRNVLLMGFGSASHGPRHADRVDGHACHSADGLVQAAAASSCAPCWLAPINTVSLEGSLGHIAADTFKLHGDSFSRLTDGEKSIPWWSTATSIAPVSPLDKGVSRVKYAAFFRNLNLGRPRCPNKPEFEEAFMVAGAATASSFLTNGTIVFTAETNSEAQGILASAREILRETCGLKEPGYIRTTEYLAKLVSLNPFGSVERASVHECCASFVCPEAGSLMQLPTESKRRDVKVLHVTESEVFSVSLRVGATPGSPNAFLERLLGVPVTTRSWNTVVRLLQRHA